MEVGVEKLWLSRVDEVKDEVCGRSRIADEGFSRMTYLFVGSRASLQ